MAKQSRKQTEQIDQLAFMSPINILEGMTPTRVGQPSYYISAFGDTQKLTPSIIERSNLCHITVIANCLTA